MGEKNRFTVSGSKPAPEGFNPGVQIRKNKEFTAEKNKGVRAQHLTEMSSFPTGPW